MADHIRNHKVWKPGNGPIPDGTRPIERPNRLRSFEFPDENYTRRFGVVSPRPVSIDRNGDTVPLVAPRHGRADQAPADPRETVPWVLVSLAVVLLGTSALAIWNFTRGGGWPMLAIVGLDVLIGTWAAINQRR